MRLFRRRPRPTPHCDHDPTKPCGLRRYPGSWCSTHGGSVELRSGDELVQRGDKVELWRDGRPWTP